ncbi:hypothetical protein LEP1GSC133_0883 [Leptospira borgpetersenii serovar Pomona str. 200901868]|uniref:Uncharacterized protein n=1 Tax=Leptospira borgpetersenii serovar Pomona str. 200901868 TaxID=1192866 RepID=M6W9L8_LEPBO|nr:hypothetical protein LEP1GSC133_0883 [Leptospira borgpetersenii serovar Pomona str. 200901868]
MSLRNFFRDSIPILGFYFPRYFFFFYSQTESFLNLYVEKIFRNRGDSKSRKAHERFFKTYILLSISMRIIPLKLRENIRHVWI